MERIRVRLDLLSVIVGLVVFWFQIICNKHYHWKRILYEEAPLEAINYKSQKFTRKDVYIPVVGSADESVLHGWLLLPNHVEKKPLPLVLMSHGLGSQKDMGLLPFAEKFVAAGFAALMIDYRYFGGSKGRKNMRNLISPWRHVEDIKTALDAVKNGVLGPAVNGKQVILWGTSFAGGHVLEAARDIEELETAVGVSARQNQIKGVISMVPHLNGKAASKRAIMQRGVLGTLRVALIAAADLIVSQLLGLSPFYVRIMGSIGDTAYMTLEAAGVEEYFKKHPTVYLGGWQNLAPARTLAFMSFYNPIEAVSSIKANILFIAATRDELCPIEFVREAETLSPHPPLRPRRKLLEVNTSHFELYAGKPFETITFEMTHFAKAMVQ